MRNSRTKRLTTFFSLMVLLGSLLVASTAGANDTASHTKPATNVLDLVLNDVDMDKFVYTDSGATYTENIAVVQQCKAEEDDESDDLVSLSATATGNNPVVGLRNHALGVKAQGEGNGEPCRRINGGQSLTIRIDDTSKSAAPEIENKFIGSFQIAATFKFNGDMKVERLLDGVVVAQDTPDPQIALQCDGSDCGPDSGLAAADAIHYDRMDDGDLIDDVLFNGVRITSTGAVSIIDVLSDSELDTWFEIVDGINCGDTTDPVGTTGEINGEFWRISNLDGNPCVPKPFDASVDEEDDVISFVPGIPGSTERTAAYIGTITSKPYPSGPSQPTKKLNYDPLDGSGARVMEWCDVGNASPLSAPWDDPLTGTDAAVPLAAILGFVADPELSGEEFPEVPTDETWCLVHTETVPISGGMLVTVFDVTGEGDPNFF